jgi:arabinofuranosyltransferase
MHWKSSPVTSVVLLFLGAIAIRVPFVVLTVDDAFITFRYARNLAAGLGFVYNVGEHVLGTTTPLYTLFLAFCARLGLDFVLVGKLVNILADALVCVLMYLIAREVGSNWLAWCVALLLALIPYRIYYSATGMETGLYTLLVLLNLYLYVHDRWIGMAVAAGALVLVRPDGLLAVVAVGLAWVIQRKNTVIGLKAALLFGVLQIPWLLFAWWYFGSPVPNSISAKALSYQAPAVIDWVVAFGQVLSQGKFLGSVCLGGLFFLGLAWSFAFETGRRLGIYILWFFLYIAVFTLARAGLFGWYFVPPMPIAVLFVCLGVYAGFQKVIQVPSLAVAFDRIKPGLVVGGAAFLLVLMGVSLNTVWQDAEKEEAFQQKIAQPIGDWLRSSTPPNTTVALESIGAIGWYSERYIIDEGGLVSKQVRASNELTPGEINVFGILQTFKPDYYVAWEHWELDTRLADPVMQAWLHDNYEELQRYDDGLKEWVLFKRRSKDISLE